MKQNMNVLKDKLLSFWSAKSGKQKRLIIGSIIAIILVIGISSFFVGQTKMVPLYNNLSLQEVGQIKAELDARSVPYELEGGGTTIMVPDDQADSLLVDLASQGLPDSGNIDYSFFSNNASWGMTDNEFDLIKLDAMQTELANLITGIEGIEDAKVMINKPQDPVFVSDQAEAASASIVLTTQPGYQFETSQVETLYRLVSKTVPNLPTDNIVIMDQNFQYFDLENPTASANTDAYTFQQSVKNDIERDIQRRVQQMIGMMVGQDKVIASVTADIDFTQENRTEELVSPVNEEDMEGLPVSIETIKETYTGTPPANGVVGAGEEDVANYPGATEGSTGDYEMVKESINNEFNRIKKDIVESPYKIRDLGIQVAVDKAKYPTENGEEVELLSEEEQLAVQEGISSILNSIVTTSIDEGYGEVVPEEKTSIVFQEFQGKTSPTEVPTTGIPTWMYIAGGAALLVIAGLVIWLMRRRKATKEVEEVTVTDVPTREEFVIPEMEQGQDSESTVRRKQLEKMAQDKPEDFAKLLRSWIAED
ncbi:flagellar M-ring protein FliF [Radiobacillus kanasensis]|uniref:flagellar basal-body MS-ring/collar protein FliF n=1 Tax=Radiobacillus kanasensis TaxID=2844358 RepID=UPI001E4D24C5|nr:flagellar basal-body MS-ring/collar protein FliF [Radiobacillus kanasensis]UFU01022.1 flagellar M-ring protein FliF [Radiobacillus kanasensis]